MTRVGNLCFLFLCWTGIVPNLRQLSIVVSDWGSYLGNLFPTCSLWDLVFGTVLFSPTRRYVSFCICCLGPEVYRK
jgi:hypothetical protein